MQAVLLGFASELNGERNDLPLPAHVQAVTDSRKTSPALGEVPLFVR